jgi:hypothetical protein
MSDKERVESILGGIKMPAEVLSFDFNFSEDSTGEPAVWINLHVKEDYDPSTAKIDRFVAIKKEIARKILDAQMQSWPYVRLVTEKR